MGRCASALMIWVLLFTGAARANDLAASGFLITAADPVDQSCPAAAHSSEQPSAGTTASTALRVAGTTILKSAWACAKGVLQGAWSSTGGRVGEAIDCIEDVIACAERAGAAVRNAIDFVSHIVTRVQQVFSGRSAEELSGLICSIVGSLGTDVLLVMLTAGAASGKFGVTLAEIAARITKIAEIIGKFASFPLQLLGKLSERALATLNELVEAGYGTIAMKTLKECM